MVRITALVMVNEAFRKCMGDVAGRNIADIEGTSKS